jgi:hypothetical protein
VFSVLGGALYKRRHELGLETWVSPERAQGILRKQELLQSQHELTAASVQVRAGSHTQGWQRLQAWLPTRGHDPDDYRSLCERLARALLADFSARYPGDPQVAAAAALARHLSP